MDQRDKGLATVGIVVPTLGQRPQYLTDCLRSIRAAGECVIYLVAPDCADLSEVERLDLVDEVVPDPGAGLAAAINAGINALPETVKYANWLGDDDLLEPLSLEKSILAFEQDPELVMTFGSCKYIDDSGKLLWVNDSGPWAVPLLRFGPDLIPQPGALFTVAAFKAVGGLQNSYKLAFDFDLFIRFAKVGRLKYLNIAVASFRWHTESLSVGSRWRSVKEASEVRRSHLPAFLAGISWLWEYPVMWATFYAGSSVTRKARSYK